MKMTMTKINLGYHNVMMSEEPNCGCGNDGNKCWYWAPVCVEAFSPDNLYHESFMSPLQSVLYNKAG